MDKRQSIVDNGDNVKAKVKFSIPSRDFINFIQDSKLFVKK
jgi:hypothetical protein